ncbi:MAG: hypothetical protein IB618_01930 [Candidatus Pacearchaeota archaeon]|nr:MAG: hypothetical protein IB618_01930 [Candidatus Pacearchaeota archaeon]
MERLRSTLLFLMFLFVFVFALTQASAFTITSNITTNTVCPSSTIVIEDIVTASTAGAFTVTVEGTAATFTTSVPTGFWLEGGQAQSIYSYITPSSQVTPGNYKLKITVEKANGNIKTVEHNVIVENCHNTILSVEPETLMICACEEETILLNINNMGNYLENYDIIVEGPAADWISLSSESVTLASCTETDIEVYVLTPCNVAGTYEVNFVVTSESPYAQANKVANIEIVSCYDYTLSSEKIYYRMCEAEELSIPIKIRNLGTRDNIYRINMYGPSWTTLDQKTLNVAEGEEKTFNIIARPPYMTEGNFSVNIEILTDYGKVLKKYDVSIDVEKCYGVSVTIEEEEDRMCNALSNTYAVIVRNNGKFDNTFDITLEGQEWATISEKHFTLTPGEEKSFILDIHPPYNTLGGAYDFTIKARDPLSGAEAEDTISISTVTIEDCYKPSISAKDDVIRVAKDSTATGIFIIENKGEQPAHYNIEISGTGTSFSQINPGAIDIEPGEAQTVYLYIAPPPETQLQDYKVTVTVRLEDTTILASDTVTISVVETEELEPIIPEPVEEEEESWFQKIINWIANIFTPKQAEEENVTEEQPEEEPEPGEEEQEEEEVEEVEQQFSGSEGDSFKFNIKDEEHTAEIEEVGDDSVTIQILSEPFIVDLNIGETKQFDTDGNGYLDLEITLNNITDGVADLTFKELEEEIPEEEPEEEIEEPVEGENQAPILAKEFPDIEIPAGQSYEIDLADYFEDPDGDDLTFVTVKPLNVDVSITGSVIKLTPQPDMEGEEREVTFYASDGKELVQSNVVTITITEAAEPEEEEPEPEIEEPTEEEAEEEEEKPETVDFFSQYRGLIIAGIIILIIIILLLSGLGKKIIGFFEEEAPVNNRKK